MKITLIVLSLLVVLSSCTMSAEVVDKNKVVSCTDTKDGEKFSFKTDNIKNAQIGMFSDSCYDVTDDKGFERTLCKSQEKYFKCKSISIQIGEQNGK